MAGPITWQNINAPNLSEASRPLEAAQRALSGAFDQLGSLVKDRETVDTKNWEAGRANNTAAFLDQLSKYATPEALAAAQASGELDKIRAGFGSQIDPNAVRGAFDQRMGALRTNAKQGIEFDRMMRDERTAPLVDQFRAATLAGDTAKAAALQGQYAQMGGRDLAGMVGFADQRSRELVNRTQQDGKYTDTLETSKAQRSKWAADTANDTARVGIAQAGLGLERERMGMQREQHLMTLEERLGARAGKLREEMGNVKGILASSQQGTEAIYKAIATLKDADGGDAMESARLIAPKIIATPGMTTADAIAAIMGIDTNWNLDSNARQRTMNTATEMSNSSASLDRKKNAELRQQLLSEEQETVRARQNEILDKLNGSGVTVGKNPFTIPDYSRK